MAPPPAPGPFCLNADGSIPGGNLPDTPIITKAQRASLRGLRNNLNRINSKKSRAVLKHGKDSAEVAAIEIERVAEDKKILKLASSWLGSRSKECPDRRSPLAKRIRREVLSESQLEDTECSKAASSKPVKSKPVRRARSRQPKHSRPGRKPKNPFNAPRGLRYQRSSFYYSCASTCTSSKSSDGPKRRSKPEPDVVPSQPACNKTWTESLVRAWDSNLVTLSIQTSSGVLELSFQPYYLVGEVLHDIAGLMGCNVGILRFMEDGELIDVDATVGSIDLDSDLLLETEQRGGGPGAATDRPDGGRGERNPRDDRDFAAGGQGERYPRNDRHFRGGRYVYQCTGGSPLPRPHFEAQGAHQHHLRGEGPRQGAGFEDVRLQQFHPPPPGRYAYNGAPPGVGPGPPHNDWRRQQHWQPNNPGHAMVGSGQSQYHGGDARRDHRRNNDWRQQSYSHYGPGGSNGASRSNREHRYSDGRRQPVHGQSKAVSSFAGSGNEGQQPPSRRLGPVVERDGGILATTRVAPLDDAFKFYLGNLDWHHHTASEIKDFFSQFGSVNCVSLFPHKGSGAQLHAGQGYLHMLDLEGTLALERYAMARGGNIPNVLGRKEVIVYRVATMSARSNNATTIVTSRSSTGGGVSSVQRGRSSQTGPQQQLGLGRANGNIRTMSRSNGRTILANDDSRDERRSATSNIVALGVAKLPTDSARDDDRGLNVATTSRSNAMSNVAVMASEATKRANANSGSNVAAMASEATKRAHDCNASTRKAHCSSTSNVLATATGAVARSNDRSRSFASEAEAAAFPIPRKKARAPVLPPIKSNDGTASRTLQVIDPNVQQRDKRAVTDMSKGASPLKTSATKRQVSAKSAISGNGSRALAAAEKENGGDDDLGFEPTEEDVKRVCSGHLAEVELRSVPRKIRVVDESKFDRIAVWALDTIGLRNASGRRAFLDVYSTDPSSEKREFRRHLIELLVKRVKLLAAIKKDPRSVNAEELVVVLNEERQLLGQILRRLLPRKLHFLINLGNPYSLKTLLLILMHYAPTGGEHNDRDDGQLDLMHYLQCCVRLVQQSLPRRIAHLVTEERTEETFRDEITVIDFASFAIEKGTLKELGNQLSKFATILGLESRAEEDLICVASVLGHVALHHVVSAGGQLTMYIASSPVAEAYAGKTGLERFDGPTTTDMVKQYCGLHSEAMFLGWQKTLPADVRHKLNVMYVAMYGPILGLPAGSTCDLMGNFGRDCQAWHLGALNHIAKVVTERGAWGSNIMEAMADNEVFQCQLKILGERVLLEKLPNFRAAQERNGRRLTLATLVDANGHGRTVEAEASIKEFARDSNVDIDHARASIANTRNAHQRNGRRAKLATLVDANGHGTTAEVEASLEEFAADSNVSMDHARASIVKTQQGNDYSSELSSLVPYVDFDGVGKTEEKRNEMTQLAASRGESLDRLQSILGSKKLGLTWKGKDATLGNKLVRMIQSWLLERVERKSNEAKKDRLAKKLLRKAVPKISKETPVGSLSVISRTAYDAKEDELKFTLHSPDSFFWAGNAYFAFTVKKGSKAEDAKKRAKTEMVAISIILMKALQHHKYDKDQTAEERKRRCGIVKDIICHAVGRE